MQQKSAASVRALIQIAKVSARALLLVTCLLVARFVPAQALTGAVDTTAADPGARASLLLSYKGDISRCGGVVYRDRYILTAAHCFTDGRGNISKPAAGWEVRYWSADQRREVRRVEKVMLHENFPGQEKAAYPAPQPWDLKNFPAHHEDIAVLVVAGTHPSGVMSVAIPKNESEYKSETPSGGMWFFVYGASKNGKSWSLQRATTGIYGAMERIVLGKEPGIWYIVRKFFIQTENTFMKDISVCSGDSGSGVFLAHAPEIAFEGEPEQKPTDIAMIRDRLVLMGLVTNAGGFKGLVTDRVKVREGCGREQGASSIVALRMDYFRNWILEKTGGDEP